MSADPLQLLLQTSRERAVQSLNSDSDKQFANPTYGTIIPLEVAKVVPISNPSGVRVFDPQSWAGWTGLKAGLGNGFVPPVQGIWYILSGIPLTSGTVTNAKRFKIVEYQAGDSFTNIGAGSNASGVVFTSTGTTPTTWTNGSELQEITADLPFDATADQVEAALNSTQWVTAGGGLTVEGSMLYFFAGWVTDGARTQMIGFASNLAPLSIVEIATLIEGDANLQEVQTIRVYQNVGAFCNLTDESDPADVDVDEVTVGGGGANAKYRVTLLPTPYDGSWSLTIRGIESAMIGILATEDEVRTALENISINSGALIVGAKYTIVSFAEDDDFTNVGGDNVTGNVFTASGTTPTTWTHGSVLSPVAAGNVAVARELDGQYLIVFQAALANTDMGTITGSADALQVIPYRKGTLNLDTAGVQLLLGASRQVSAFLVITGIPPDESYPQELYRQAVTLQAAILPANSTAPTPFIVYYDSAVSDERYARRDSDSAVLVGVITGPAIAPRMRFLPITNGGKIQVSTDGSAWQDAMTFTAS